MAPKGVALEDPVNITVSQQHCQRYPCSKKLFTFHLAGLRNSVLQQLLKEHLVQCLGCSMCLLQYIPIISTGTSYNLLHASPLWIISFKNQMHKEKAEVHFICLHKIKCLHRKYKTDLKLRLRTDLDGDTAVGYPLQAGWSEWAQWQLCPPSQHNGFSRVSQQHPDSYLICFPTNILFCSWICSTEREADLPCTVHTFFSKQSGMPNQQKAPTLFSEVINWNGKPAHCDSITKELLHSSAAGIVSINCLREPSYANYSSVPQHSNLQFPSIYRIATHNIDLNP